MRISVFHEIPNLWITNLRSEFRRIKQAQWERSRCAGPGQSGMQGNQALTCAGPLGGGHTPCRLVTEGRIRHSWVTSALEKTFSFLLELVLHQTESVLSFLWSRRSNSQEKGPFWTVLFFFTMWVLLDLWCKSRKDWATGRGGKLTPQRKPDTPSLSSPRELDESGGLPERTHLAKTGLIGLHTDAPSITPNCLWRKVATQWSVCHPCWCGMWTQKQMHQLWAFC